MSTLWVAVIILVIAVIAFVVLMNLLQGRRQRRESALRDTRHGPMARFDLKVPLDDEQPAQRANARLGGEPRGNAAAENDRWAMRGFDRAGGQTEPPLSGQPESAAAGSTRSESGGLDLGRSDLGRSDGQGADAVREDAAVRATPGIGSRWGRKSGDSGRAKAAERREPTFGAAGYAGFLAGASSDDERARDESPASAVGTMDARAAQEDVRTGPPSGDRVPADGVPDVPPRSANPRELQQRATAAQADADVRTKDANARESGELRDSSELRDVSEVREVREARDAGEARDAREGHEVRDEDDVEVEHVVVLAPEKAVNGERLFAIASTLRHVGSKPIRVEIERVAGQWEPLQSGGQVRRVRCAVLLANRQGPLNPVELSDFDEAVASLARQIHAPHAASSASAVLERARQLDALAADLDTHVDLRVECPDVMPAVRVAELARRLNLLDKGHGRHLCLSENGDVVCSMRLGAPDQLEFVLDLPRTRQDLDAWRSMVSLAGAAAKAVGGRVIDGAGRGMSVGMIDEVERQLQRRYEALHRVGLRAGSPASMRVFN